jgi:hypothetical protein
MGWTSVKDWDPNTILTAAQLDTYLSDNTDFLKKNIALESAVELTISSGAVTKSQAYHSIDTEGDASEDDLDTISGTSEGEIIIIRAEHADRTVVLKNGTGNLILGGDIYLDDTDKHVILISDGTNLHLLFTARQVTFMVNIFQYPAPGTDWTPAITGATLAANKSAKKCWLPLNFLKIGDGIVSYKVVGDMHEEGGDTCTFDCKLVRVNKADPLTTTDVAGGGITQVDADGNFDAEATLTDLETVATDKQYLLELEGTTSNVSTNEAIKVIGAEVKVWRLT